MGTRRIAHLQRRLRAGEARLITAPPDLHALTGVPLEGCWLLLLPAELVCLSSRMVSSAVRTLLPDVPVRDGARLLSLLVAFRTRVRRLYVDRRIPWELYRSLQRWFTVIPDAETERVRMVKTDAEIAALRQAGRRCAEVVRWAEQLLRPGVTEREVARRIAAAYLEHGVTESFPTIVAFDANTAFPHHVPGGARFQRGGIALIDTGCRVDGMCSDVTRMYGGETRPEVRAVERELRALHRQLIAMCRPGVAVAAIDRRARDVCRRKQWLSQYLHTTGHGVGMEIHEAPRVSIADRTVLAPGMTLTIEPGVYFAGRFGVRIEDTVLVTRDQPEVLTAM